MGELSISLRIYEEGAVRFYARAVDPGLKGPLRRSEAFYNPAMRSNRDIAVAVVRWGVSDRGWRSAADVMAASGVRALRLAAETEVNAVIANDVNPLSAYIMKKNVELNGLKARVRIFQRDARALLYELAAPWRRLDFIDVDPYGTPSPYVEAALTSVRPGGVIGVTATDTPNLFAVYPRKLTRVYGVICPSKPPFSKELGVRALLGLIARVAARGDRWIFPLLSYAEGHYVRVYVEVGLGARRADDMLRRSMGWVRYCRGCGGWDVVEGADRVPTPERCSLCGGEMSICGPLWIGPMISGEFIGKMSREMTGSVSRDSVKLVEGLAGEAEAPPLYYDLDFLSSKLKISSPSPREVVNGLRSAGYRAIRTHFCAKCVKTNATVDAVIGVVRDLRL